MSSISQITSIYQQLFGSDPDQSEIATYTAMLDAGADLSLVQAMMTDSANAELVDRRASAAGPLMDATAAALVLDVLDTQTNQPISAIPSAYIGPVSGLQEQYVVSGSDSVNISVSTPNWFLHGGSGNDAIAVYGGINVIDGGAGSNFLSGGDGTDTFFIDDRSPASDIWTTLNGFHAGDAATIVGITPNQVNIQWSDGQGASAYTGLTLHVTIPNRPTASLTLAGYSTADLSDGVLSVMFGAESDGTPYMYILGKSSNLAPAPQIGNGPTIVTIPSNLPPTAGVDFAATVVKPSQPGDLVGVRLQNTGSSTEASGYVTFGQVFVAGSLRPADSLVARINGVNYAVQMDVKSTNADGSIRQAILTLDAPSIGAGGTLDLMLAKGSATGPSPAAPSVSSLLASGYDVGVSFSFHNPDGTTTTDSASAKAALQAALSAGKVQNWLGGPGVNEYDVVTTVDGGKLKVEFDIRAYADGTTTTDVIFDNGWMFSPGKSNLNYDVSVNQAGQQVYSANGINQYLNSLWHHQVTSPGSTSPNIQYDVAYLISTGAIPAYDTSLGVSDAAIQTNVSGLNTTNTGPMGTAEVTTYMPMTGGRPDIGPQPNWVAQWLMSQNGAARTVMMADADAAGGIPWYYTDENTGKPINEQTYPKFWQSASNTGGFWTPLPANGWSNSSADPWTPDNAHQPDLNYVPYLVNGSHYELDLLQAQADYSITSMNPYYLFNNYGNTVDPTNPGSWTYLGASSPAYQERGIAWSLRQIAEAAYITPDSDPLKSYFVSELDTAMSGFVSQYITNNINAPYSQITGFIRGAEYGTAGLVSPWQMGYIVATLGEIANMNIPQASAQAVQALQYTDNFVSGLFTNGVNGYNPFNGTAYWLYVNDPTTGAPYTSWSQLQSANVVDYTLNSSGWGLASANPTVFGPAATDMDSGYPIIAKAALAEEVTYAQSPQAIQAYGFVVAQIANVWASNGGNSAQIAAWQADPEWSIMPRLPDGVYLPNSQMQIDTSGASQVTLTAAGGDSLLAVVGSGSATLTGATGSCDLLFGGSGPTTLKAGIGNDYLFGGAGATSFIDNTGNNYMHGGSSANTYMFSENNSGHDTIANFNVSTDRLQIGPNLNGNGFTNASQLIAAATTSNGNTVFHLGNNNDITLLGVSSASTLANAILVQ